MLIGTVITILLVSFTPISLDQFQNGGRFITAFITPATVALAVQIYNSRKILAENWLPVLAGCAAGSCVSIGSVYILCRLCLVYPELMVSLLPKSVTSAIAMELAESNGGIGSIAVVAVILTGIICAVLAPVMVKVFKLKNDIAIGTGIGTAGHAIGTAKAMEYGSTVGAISGIAIGVAGILTAVFFTLLTMRELCKKIKEPNRRTKVAEPLYCQIVFPLMSFALC